MCSQRRKEKIILKEKIEKFSKSDLDLHSILSATTALKYRAPENASLEPCFQITYARDKMYLNVLNNF
jgi:hypothetical protein